MRQGPPGLDSRCRGGGVLPVPRRRPDHVRGLHRLQPAPPGGAANARRPSVPGLLAPASRGGLQRVRRGPSVHHRHPEGASEVHLVRQAADDVQRLREGRPDDRHGLRHGAGVLDVPQEGPVGQRRVPRLRPASTDRPPRPRPAGAVLGLRRAGALERVHGVWRRGPHLRGRALHRMHIGAPPSGAARLLRDARPAPRLPRRLGTAPGRAALARQAGVSGGLGRHGPRRHGQHPRGPRRAAADSGSRAPSPGAGYRRRVPCPRRAVCEARDLGRRTARRRRVRRGPQGCGRLRPVVGPAALSPSDRADRKVVVFALPSPDPCRNRLHGLAPGPRRWPGRVHAGACRAVAGRAAGTRRCPGLHPLGLPASPRQRHRHRPAAGPYAGARRRRRTAGGHRPAVRFRRHASARRPGGRPSAALLRPSPASSG